uniref:hypothetical protein n=1 Tax=Bifidobacterium longum TaxID=216816 RepID=UPI0015E82D8D|nr:hypothetical protein [Bifidobacterium longum]
MDISMDTHMDTSMDTHMDTSMDIHMEMPINRTVAARRFMYMSDAAHQIEGKQARRFMYMNRTQHLPRPSAQEQQPECRRPMEEEKE